ncbi:UNVERIFIED_CONTAM: hypothetical protein Sangu_2225300 [Sesamum angustifolium]|uniref:Uncharacterized protein n=1 Tax=Sesamum angustifolium TaxID=2727405 RepID=A0AAW2L599_9LAMI
METPSNALNKEKTVETFDSAQVLKVMPGTPLVPSSKTTIPGHPMLADPLIEPPRLSTSSKNSLGELPLGLLGTIQQMIKMTIREQMATLVPACAVTLSNVDVPKEKGKRVSPAPAPLVAGSQGPPSQI